MRTGRAADIRCLVGGAGHRAGHVLAGATAQPGPQPVTVSFTNDGRLPAADVRLSLAVPGGWTAKPASRLVFPAVPSGRTVQATWQVTEGSPDQPFGGYQVIAAASFRWGAGTRGSSPPVSQPVTEDTTVQPPLRTLG